MKRIIVTTALLFSFACALVAQGKQYWSLKKGDWAIGIIFNPDSLSYQMLAQPEPGTFEGFSAYTGKVEQYTGLVSPGSNALLYGTENIGGRLSLNYYF